VQTQPGVEKAEIIYFSKAGIGEITPLPETGTHLLSFNCQCHPERIPLAEIV
jgi:hypothetical protein